MTSGRIPARLASMAHARPVGPAPTQIKSYIWLTVLVCPGTDGNATERVAHARYLLGQFERLFGREWEQRKGNSRMRAVRWAVGNDRSGDRVGHGIQTRPKPLAERKHIGRPGLQGFKLPECLGKPMTFGRTQIHAVIARRRRLQNDADFQQQALVVAPRGLAFERLKIHRKTVRALAQHHRVDGTDQADQRQDQFVAIEFYSHNCRVVATPFPSSEPAAARSARRRIAPALFRALASPQSVSFSTGTTPSRRGGRARSSFPSLGSSLPRRASSRHPTPAATARHILPCARRPRCCTAGATAARNPAPPAARTRQVAAESAPQEPFSSGQGEAWLGGPERLGWRSASFRLRPDRNPPAGAPAPSGPSEARRSILRAKRGSCGTGCAGERPRFPADSGTGTAAGAARRWLPRDARGALRRASSHPARCAGWLRPF